MKKINFWFLLIIVIAAFLRFYQIDQNPKAMYGDELTAVYDAYSILKTNHDQKGNFLPLTFSLGGGRPPLYVYATIPFVALFGPTALASRFVSVLSGIGIVFLLYLVGRKLFSEKAGLIMAAVSAINPWALSLSRGPFESNFALFLALLGFFAFLKKGYWLLAFGLSFGLAMQTYAPYRLIIPALTAILALQGRALRGYLAILSLGIIAVSTVLGIYLTLSRGSEDRFDIINIFKNQDLRSQISQKVQKDRLLDSLSPSYSHMIHTPYAEMAGVLAKNYFSNFFPDFLFVHGDKAPRHNPAEMGLMLWIDAVLIILGIVYLYKKDKKLLFLLASWAVIAPIPTALVGEAHALRSSFLLPPLLVLSGIGLWKAKRTLLILLAIIFVIEFIYFFDRFYFLAPKKQARFWSYPAKEAYILAEKNKQKFDAIFLSNDIDNMEFAYPTYAKENPNIVIEQNKSPFKIGEYRFFKYGNIYIGSLPNSRVMQFVKDLPGSVLYIGAEKEQPFLENYNVIRGFDSEVDLVTVAKGVQADLTP